MTQSSIPADERTSTLEVDSDLEVPQISIKEATPLPIFQLFIVSLIQIAEPITATVIYPFITKAVTLTGVTNGDEAAIGYYAGIIESIFFFAEALTVYHWALASDYYGRKPILLLGPLGLGISMLGFGLSRQFGWLVFFRFFQGNFNGLIGVSKTVMAELTDSTNMAAAFSLIPLMWSTGIVTGPMIGGQLFNPSGQWSWFNTEFWRTYPYFLPCAAAGAIAFLATFLGSFMLKETSTNIISKKRKEYEQLDPESTGLLRDSAEGYGTSSPSSAPSPAPQQEIENPPALRELLHSDFVIVLISYGFLAFIDMSYQVLIPLVYSGSHSLGGLEFLPDRIGKLLASVGISAALAQLFVVGRLLKRYNARVLFVLGFGLEGVSIACLGLMGRRAQQIGDVDAICWLLIVVQLSCSLGTYLAYTGLQIMVVGTAKNKAALASHNSVSQMLGCAARGIAPSAASSLFSVSLSRHLLGGYMVYAILLGLWLVGMRVAWMLPRKLNIS